MKIKYLIRTIILVLLCVAILFGIQSFLSNPDSHASLFVYSVAKEKKDSIDVAFVGTSDVYTSFYAPLAYKQEGFTSAVLATPGLRGSCVKSALNLIREKQDPDLYVIELYTFLYENQYSESELRKWIDSLPFGKNKFDTINDLIAEEDRASYYFPLLKYHGSMDRISADLKAVKEKNFIDSNGSIIKNFSTCTNNMIGKTADPLVDVFDISEQGMVLLDELLQFLEENNIDNVLFIRTPEWNRPEVTDNYKIALQKIDEAGFDFLDIGEYYDALGLDSEKDYYNTGHVNVYGMEKITAFLAEYISDNYQIDMEHREDVTEEWDNCASYCDFIIDKLKKATDARENKTIFCNIDYFN